MLSQASSLAQTFRISSQPGAITAARLARPQHQVRHTPTLWSKQRGERDRHRDQDRQIEKQKWTYRQRETQTERQRRGDRETQRERERGTQRESDGEAETQRQTQRLRDPRGHTAGRGIPDKKRESHAGRKNHRATVRDGETLWNP